MYTFFDTETTDIWYNKRPHDHPSQPRIVSLGAVAYSDDFMHEVQSMYAIIKPEGYVIDNNSQACKVNGITHEIAMEYGLPWDVAVTHFDHMCFQSKRIFAFNADFDNRLIRRESDVHKRQHYVEPLKLRCVMLAMAGIMKIPNRNGYEDWAWPKLDEAYEFCFQMPFSGAHNAMVDAKAAAFIGFHAFSQGWWDFERVMI